MGYVAFPTMVILPGYTIGNQIHTDPSNLNIKVRIWVRYKIGARFRVKVGFRVRVQDRVRIRE